jgi:hypothetical protein
MGKFSQQLEGIGEPTLTAITGQGITTDYGRIGKTARDVKEEMVHGFRYGKARGETTHCKQIDSLFTWKLGFLYCFTGWPQAGKSQALLFLAMLKAKFSGWVWVVYSPESGKPGEYFDELVHCLVGKSTDPFFTNVMSEKEYLAAIDFVSKHFIFLDDEEYEKQGIEPTPEVLRKTFEYYHTKNGCKGFIKDPWNALAGGDDIRDDKYLKRELTAEKRLAVRLNIANVILAHPKEFQGQYDPEKGLPVPRPKDLAGGAMWNNRCDVIGAFHRPYVHKDPRDTNVVFHTRKVKQQRLVGSIGDIDMVFNPQENRYYIAGACPLITPGIQPEYLPGKLPDSIFEKEVPPPF